ncbi:hypothetical protein SLE2022_236710 [Rubroshorea leprosula]
MEANQSVTFYDFLDRMRNPASLDLVRSIKSFIVSFSFYPANPENDGKKVQEFFLTMEAALRDHPLWAGATDEEIDSAMEGLEKYVMTKLFSRTFASLPEDVKFDREISEKICLLQAFLRPEHLDIPVALQNETSWLLAEKELQKINAFKAPREKLLCITNCCRVINNLLLNASMSGNHVPGGADDFLPVIIYVTIKASSPWLILHSCIPISNSSSCTGEIEFEESMQAARLANKATQVENPPTTFNIEVFRTDPGPSKLLDEKETRPKGGSKYPYMDAEAGELTVGDVEKLLSLYKDVVTRYTTLCSKVRHLSISKTDSPVTSEGTSSLATELEETCLDANGKKE